MIGTQYALREFQRWYSSHKQQGRWCLTNARVAEVVDDVNLGVHKAEVMGYWTEGASLFAVRNGGVD
jgi:hypothetical protein